LGSLRELQQLFAAALRDPDGVCAVTPAANLDIYRNNSDIAFRSALESSFPVLLRRVGEDYFRQLAREYRQRFPSRSGDLHWAGKNFADFLAQHLASGDYSWLADLARLEWARELAAVSLELPAVDSSVLAKVPADQLEHVEFALQPGLQLLSSPYPVFSVWFANQGDNGPPVAQSLGGETGMVHIRHQCIEVARLEPSLFSYLCATVNGASIAEAMAVAGVDGEGLSAALRFMFGHGLVVSMSLSEG
jgi:hypothetical protein